MSAPPRLDCGCRRSARRRGHRLQCTYFNQESHTSRRNRQRFARRWYAQEGFAR